MGHATADWENAGRFSPLGDTAADRAGVTAEQGWDMEVTSPGGGDGRGGHAGGGYLRRPPL